MRRSDIPDIVIRRLPIYERTLKRMLATGLTSVSSEELGERIGVTAAQIRRDLSYFGKFGKQGKGYDIQGLADEIQHILNLDHQWDVALAGFGHLGQAIAHYRGFEPNGFRIAAIFARSPEQIGQQVNGVVVLHDGELTRVVREMGIKIGIVAVPAEAAQDVAERMLAGGVRAILNYAPVILKVPDDVWVREIDPTGALQSLTYYLDGRPGEPFGDSLTPEAAGG
ncbi:MAG TPA: redox-sensing transcriptional repressor Rex [Thermomicrobiaceae bacterium]|nr:redox-sensing transcriptional repressor Rex [Thermomicrobiaceae bacterium]